MTSQEAITAQLSDGSRIYVQKVLELSEWMDSVAKLIRKDWGRAFEDDIEKMYGCCSEISSRIMESFSEKVKSNIYTKDSKEM